MGRVLLAATQISSWLGIIGFLAAAFFFLVRQIISTRLVKQATPSASAEILRLIVTLFFVLALVAMFLGAILHVVDTLGRQRPTNQPAAASKADSADIVPAFTSSNIDSSSSKPSGR